MSDHTKNSYNLDLTNIETSDHTRLASEIETFYKDDSALKLQLAYHWERNHLMLDGKQWLTRNRSQNTGQIWSELRVSKANEYIPRPVTNYMYDVYQTLKSYLVQHRPRSQVRPNTQTAKDKMAAKVAELVTECNWERLAENKNYDYAANCALTYGTVFKKDYWDTSAIMMAQVPRIEPQPVIDEQTGAMMGYEDQEVMDPETGEPVLDEVPVGDVNTDVVEPYRISIDPLASDLHKARWIMEHSIQPLDWIKETYGKEEEGYTGRAAEVKEEKHLSNSLRRFFELRTSSGVSSNGLGYSAGDSTDEMVSNAAIVKEYYEKPTQQNPKGRMIVVANGITVYAGKSPCEGDELNDWHPYSEFRWETVAGRFWGKSPLNDTSELQKRINSIDATVILARKTMAIPQKLVPKGSGVKRGEWTGRPGQMVNYTPKNGMAPSTVQAAGVDAQVFQERSQATEDIKQISGAIDILKGERPPSVSAASALELLFEVGTGKLRPALDRYKDFIESSQKKQLKLVARHYQEPREHFIKLLQLRNSDLPLQAIENFIGADLRDNCNIQVEAGSNVPKLISAKKAQLQQAAQMGILNLEVPENRMRYMEEMGITGYDQDISPDVKRSEEENDKLKDGQEVIVLDVDNHEIHNEVHTREMKKSWFMEADPMIQQAYMAHVEEHRIKVEEAEQQAIEKAIAMGAAPGAAGGAPGGGGTTPGKGGRQMSQDTQETIMEADIPKRG